MEKNSPELISRLRSSTAVKLPNFLVTLRIEIANLRPHCRCFLHTIQKIFRRLEFEHENIPTNHDNCSGVGVLSFLIVPFLVPQPNSGTLTNVEAAGPDEQFENFSGLSVHVDHREYRGDCKCDAPLIILMHGFGASTYSWRSVIEPLRNLGEVIAYDRPGFGFTERPTHWAGVNPYGFEGNFRILDSIISTYGSTQARFPH